MRAEVATLRQLFRNLQQWRALYEADGIDEVASAGDSTVGYSLFDVERVYFDGVPRLSQRQRQAIKLCFVENRPRTEVAVMMGISPTNPVDMYAYDGLERLLDLMEAGELPNLFSGQRLQRSS